MIKLGSLKVPQSDTHPGLKWINYGTNRRSYDIFSFSWSEDYVCLEKLVRTWAFKSPTSAKFLLFSFLVALDWIVSRFLHNSCCNKSEQSQNYERCKSHE